MGRETETAGLPLALEPYQEPFSEKCHLWLRKIDSNVTFVTRSLIHPLRGTRDVNQLIDSSLPRQWTAEQRAIVKTVGALTVGGIIAAALYQQSSQ